MLSRRPGFLVALPHADSAGLLRWLTLLKTREYCYLERMRFSGD
jgi:hypothetical protein